MATGSLSPVGRQLFWDTTLNASLASGTVGTFITGTSTATPTYTDAGLSIPNANPIALDTTGTCVIYLDPSVGGYKFQVKNAGGTLLYTEDPVLATNAGTAGLGEVFTFGSNSSNAITNTTYNSGATFDKLNPGSQVYQVDSATLSGTYVLQATGLMVTSGTLTVSIMDLTSGAPDTPIGSCTITSLTGAVARSAAITFGAAGTLRNYGIKCIVSANTGFLIGASLVKTA